MTNFQIAMLLAGIIMAVNFWATRWIYVNRGGEAWNTTAFIMGWSAFYAVAGVVHYFVGG